MSIAEYEQRIRALEAAVVELRNRVPTSITDSNALDADAIMENVECPLVPSVPTAESQRIRARLSSIRIGRHDLALSTREWAGLDLGDVGE